MNGGEIHACAKRFTGGETGGNATQHLKVANKRTMTATVARTEVSLTKHVINVRPPDTKYSSQTLPMGLRYHLKFSSSPRASSTTFHHLEKGLTKSDYKVLSPLQNTCIRLNVSNTCKIEFPWLAFCSLLTLWSSAYSSLH